MCGISVPSGRFKCNLNDRIRTEDGDGSDATIPFGITLLGKPWEDDFVGDIATKFTGF
jgi:Asp-tRNA(Asn)/Glu-tRNA(Gln) amidotransferase A subunit family amidase